MRITDFSFAVTSFRANITCSRAGNGLVYVSIGNLNKARKAVFAYSRILVHLTRVCRLKIKLISRSETVVVTGVDGIALNY